MGARGKKSKADLAVVPVDAVEVTERPGAPAAFTPEQRQHWTSIVNRHPVEFFHGREHLLEAYCRHIVALRHVGELLKDTESTDEFDVKDYDNLLKMQERESRCLASLSVRLGLAYSTAYEKRQAKGSRKKEKQYDF